MKDKLIESAVTAGSFMIIDKVYYKSPLGMEWKKGGLSFVACYLWKLFVPPFVKDDPTKLTTATSFFYLTDVFAR